MQVSHYRDGRSVLALRGPLFLRYYDAETKLRGRQPLAPEQRIQPTLALTWGLTIKE